MGRKRPASRRGLREAEELIISDDDEDANADLSMGIVAKAAHRGPSLSALIVLSDGDDDQPITDNPLLASPLKPYVLVPPDLALEQPLPKPFTFKRFHPRKQKVKKKKKKTTTEVVEAIQSQPDKVEGDVLFKLIADDGEDNLEMRKLLRGPRYFDLPEQGIQSCFRCGNTGHSVAQCTCEARKRACFVCGSLDHEVKDCPQGSCFICKGVGHFAKSCPNKGGDNHKARERASFCLRCGNIGHEMPMCDRDYDPGDLKGIQCYVCKQFGHLCCVDVSLTSDRQDTCYNCGDVGHTGVGCAKSRAHVDGDRKSGKAAKLCFRCGEEGHFARGCSNKREEEEVDVWDDFRTPDFRRQPVETDFQGFRSVPDFQGFRSVPAAIGAPPLRWGGRREFSERCFVTPPPVRWPERWNMAEERTWHGRRIEQRYQYIGSNFIDRGEDHFMPQTWATPTPRKAIKHKKFHGSGEAGSSSWRGKRFYMKKRGGC